MLTELELMREVRDAAASEWQVNSPFDLSASPPDYWPPSMLRWWRSLRAIALHLDALESRTPCREGAD